jgi:hypothetical protein
MAAIKRGGSSTPSVAHEAAQDKIDATLVAEVVLLKDRLHTVEVEVELMAEKRRALLEFIAQFV